MTGATTQHFESMLEHLYASVLDAARFEDFAAELRLAMNAHLIAIQTDEAGHRHSVHAHFADAPIDVPTTDYANDASINAYLARGSRMLKQRGVLDCNTLFACGELESTAFYQEVLSAVDVHYSMGFCLTTDACDPLTGLSVSRDRKRMPFEPETMQLAERLLPHLRNVYQLSQKLQQLESMATIMDRVAYGIWLLDADGQVIKANTAAAGLLEDTQGGLRLRGQSLVAAWGSDRTLLHDAIACGVSLIAARRSDILLHDAVGQPWASCTVHPLHRATLDPLLPTTQAACILLVHLFTTSSGPGTCTGTSVLHDVFRLTAAEAELAHALIEHGSLAACTRMLGKNRETLRTQLKALFAKTETRRQVDLVGRLKAALG